MPDMTVEQFGEVPIPTPEAPEKPDAERAPLRPDDKRSPAHDDNRTRLRQISSRYSSTATTSRAGALTRRVTALAATTACC